MKKLALLLLVLLAVPMFVMGGVTVPEFNPKFQSIRLDSTGTVTVRLKPVGDDTLRVYFLDSAGCSYLYYASDSLWFKPCAGGTAVNVTRAAAAGGENNIIASLVKSWGATADTLSRGKVGDTLFVKALEEGTGITLTATDSSIIITSTATGGLDSAEIMQVIRDTTYVDSALVATIARDSITSVAYADSTDAITDGGVDRQDLDTAGDYRVSSLTTDSVVGTSRTTTIGGWKTDASAKLYFDSAVVMNGKTGAWIVTDTAGVADTLNNLARFVDGAGGLDSADVMTIIRDTTYADSALVAQIARDSIGSSGGLDSAEIMTVVRDSLSTNGIAKIVVDTIGNGTPLVTLDATGMVPVSATDSLNLGSSSIPWDTVYANYVSGASAGEANTLSDTGTFNGTTGFGLAGGKTGVSLKVKGLIEGGNITITPDGDSAYSIASSGGGETDTLADTRTWNGTTGFSLKYDSLGTRKAVRGLIGAGTVTIAQSGDTALSITGSAHTVLNDSLLGTGEAAALYLPLAGGSMSSGADVTFSGDADVTGIDSLDAVTGKFTRMRATNPYFWVDSAAGTDYWLRFTTSPPGARYVPKFDPAGDTVGWWPDSTIALNDTLIGINEGDARYLGISAKAADASGADSADRANIASKFLDGTVTPKTASASGGYVLKVDISATPDTTYWAEDATAAGSPDTIAKFLFNRGTVVDTLRFGANGSETQDTLYIGTDEASVVLRSSDSLYVEADKVGKGTTVLSIFTDSVFTTKPVYKAVNTADSQLATIGAADSIAASHAAAGTTKVDTLGIGANYWRVDNDSLLPNDSAQKIIGAKSLPVHSIWMGPTDSNWQGQPTISTDPGGIIFNELYIARGSKQTDGYLHLQNDVRVNENVLDSADGMLRGFRVFATKDSAAAPSPVLFKISSDDSTVTFSSLKQITFSGLDVEGVGEPDADGEAANKKYVDTVADNYLPLAGGTMAAGADVTGIQGLSGDSLRIWADSIRTDTLLVATALRLPANSVVDSMVADGITASNYLPLAGSASAVTDFSKITTDSITVAKRFSTASLIIGGDSLADLNDTTLGTSAANALTVTKIPDGAVSGTGKVAADAIDPPDLLSGGATGQVPGYSSTTAWTWLTPLQAGGSVALTANWAAGDFDITGLDKVQSDSLVPKSDAAAGSRVGTTSLRWQLANIQAISSDTVRPPASLQGRLGTSTVKWQQSNIQVMNADSVLISAAGKLQAPVAASPTVAVAGRIAQSTDSADALIIYDAGYTSAARIPAIKPIKATVMSPATIADSSFSVFHFDSMYAPRGAKIVKIALNANAATNAIMRIYEWADQTGGTASLVDTLQLSSASRVVDQTLQDSDIAAGAHLALVFASGTANWLQVEIWYYLKP